MTNEQLVMFCAPTLAGLKTGSLFNCHYVCEEGEDRCRALVVEEFRELNLDFTEKGLRIIPLRIRGGSVLTYLYRPSELARDFSDPACRKLLDEQGYEGLDPEACVLQLKEKLALGGEFPHEIGLFLGYPVEDVRGFIEQGSDCAKCTGCWKVYGDVTSAKELFRKYDCCTACYQRQLAGGTPLKRLAVAV